MKKIKFRLANLDDKKELQEFDKISTEADIIDGKRFPVLDKKWIIKYYIWKNWFIVAELDSKIVGYILTQVVEWFHWVDKMVWIEHIWVHPDYRRLGIAYDLEKFAKKHYKWKAKFLFATIHPLNKRSIELNKKLWADLHDRKLKYIKI